MSPAEEGALAQAREEVVLLRALQLRTAAVYDALEAFDRVSWSAGVDPATAAKLGRFAAEVLDPLLEGVDGWTSCGVCGELVIPVTDDGTAALLCPVCELLDQRGL